MGMQWYASHMTPSTKDATQGDQRVHCGSRVSHFQYEITATAWIQPPSNTVCDDSSFSTPKEVLSDMQWAEW